MVMTITDQPLDADRPALSQTPTGWLATRDDFPRIGVMGSTREEAERLFRAERDAWRELAKR